MEADRPSASGPLSGDGRGTLLSSTLLSSTLPPGRFASVSFSAPELTGRLFSVSDWEPEADFLGRPKLFAPLSLREKCPRCLSRQPRTSQPERFPRVFSIHRHSISAESSTSTFPLHRQIAAKTVPSLSSIKSSIRDSQYSQRRIGISAASGRSVRWRRSAVFQWSR